MTAATWLITVFGAAPSGVGRTPNESATKVIPRNRIASRIATAPSVVAAFLGSGGLKAGTPLAIASVPVSATEPDANARIISSSPTAWVASVDPFSMTWGAPSPLTTTRNTPITIMVIAEITNR